MKFTGDSDSPIQPRGDQTSHTNTGIDCDEAVTYLMTKEYGGGWGSGAWPDGEYPERVAQCKGNQ